MGDGLDGRCGLTVVEGFGGGRGGVAGVVGDLAVETAVVEPVDVGHGGELDVVDAGPGSLAVDELPLVEAVDVTSLASGTDTSTTGSPANGMG